MEPDARHAVRFGAAANIIFPIRKCRVHGSERNELASFLFGTGRGEAFVDPGDIFVKQSFEAADPAVLGKMLDTITAERLVFGSAAPLFPQKSAMEKLQTAALPDAQKEPISSANANRLLR
jgi:hypothetical protein